jgi:hypothetical protein
LSSFSATIVQITCTLGNVRERLPLAAQSCAGSKIEVT